MTDSTYQKHGYASRRIYILRLAEEYSMSFNDVMMMAELLGEGEEFDGLVSACEDWSPVE